MGQGFELFKDVEIVFLPTVFSRGLRLWCFEDVTYKRYNT